MDPHTGMGFPVGRIVTVTLNPALDESVTVPRIRPDQKLRCSPPTREPGGGGINVARVVHRLGVDAEAMWTCGGPDGARLAGLLDAERVRHVPVPIRGETRRSLHVLETDTGQLYRFNLPGGAVDEPELQALLAGLAATDATLVVASGSLPPDIDPRAWARVVEAAPSGARIVLDTSGEGLRHALGAGVFLVKPNLRELSALVGRALGDDAEIGAAARGVVRDGGAEVVVVSLGARGMLLVTDTQEVFVDAPRIRAISAVGAGDSAVAGIVVGLARGFPLVDAVRYGAAAGAAAALTPGSELCRPEDVERLFSRLRVTA